MQRLYESTLSPKMPQRSRTSIDIQVREVWGGIFEGDKYYDSQKGYICEECLDDMSSGELLELVGESLASA